MGRDELSRKETIGKQKIGPMTKVCLAKEVKVEIRLVRSRCGDRQRAPDTGGELKKCYCYIEPNETAQITLDLQNQKFHTVQPNKLRKWATMSNTAE